MDVEPSALRQILTRTYPLDRLYCPVHVRIENRRIRCSHASYQIRQVAGRTKTGSDYIGIKSRDGAVL